MSDEFDPFDAPIDDAISSEPIALGDPNAFDPITTPGDDGELASNSSPVAAETNSIDFASNDEAAQSIPDEDPFGNIPQSENKFESFNSTPEVSDNPIQESALALWEKDRVQVLADRKAKADADKKQLLATAKADLDSFYADQKAKLDKQAKTNRADEKNYKADMKTTFESGNRWEKVAKLVNLNNKTGDKNATRDKTERFRKILITMKSSKDQEKKI